jgi:hypothetical protein
VTNALYVNNLDLSGLRYSDYEIQVDPNLIIYYVSLTGTNTPAHLTSVFGGRLVQTGVPAGGYTGSIRSPKFAAGYVSGQLQLTLDGEAGQTYIVQASTNLSNTNWVNIYTGTPPFTITSLGASNSPAFFYRPIPVQ